TYVNEQRTMYIFDRQSRGDYFKRANVSSSWINIRKLEDSKIQEVIKIIKKLEDIYQNTLEVDIALEGGELFIEGISKHEVVVNDDEMAAPAEVAPSKPQLKQEPPKQKPKISDLAKEIIQNTKDAAAEAAEQLKNFEPD